MIGDQNPAGASSGALANNPFGSLTSSRASPFSKASSSAAKSAMAGQSFLPAAQSFRPNGVSQSAYPLSIAPPVNPFDRDATKSLGTPFSATTATASLSSALIRNLPANTSEESIRLMMVFSKDLVDVDVLSVEQSEDPGSRSAILKFKSPAGAQEAKNMLDGKSVSANAAELIVEILGSSAAGLGQRYPIDTNVSNGASTATSSTASSATSSRQATRFNGTYQNLDKITPPLNGVYGSGDLINPEPSAHYQNIFSPQSPIGNHLTDRNRISGKSLIKNDAPDDDDTGELLKDPVGYAENGLQRRQTAPHIPPSGRMASLSLNTTPASGHAPIPHYGHPGMTGLSSMPNTMSPTVMGGQQQQQQQQQSYRGHNFPPANPADQNPPCNTLYVGNLPIDTSEEELKAMFSKQRGYKRLCFRTKQNGPMCFVEFEDISFATKALNDLYGQPLHNSVKGGIRLSFSKNPLGVRSGQTSSQNAAGAMGSMNGIHPGSGNGFTTANGPPPGLSAPPGLGMNRSGHSGSPNLATGGGNPYNSPAFSSPSNNPWGGMYNNHTPMISSSSSNFPAHMMGR
ncbi:hypothetical protein B0T25DRAFT_443047 [Lasiosphaeria hispida]|uniref:RRM domain-containing protein n=1 Tax=Lasiosphaeria hispida TaxID=260671 RepID=A0AAJ0HVC2_9PEZI|nr:hypothetical protein B0T25DRAFT_443047 [Lasiosphaeria hispida]